MTLLGVNRVSRTENVIVAAFLAVTCCLLAFVFCWWTAAVIQISFPGISVTFVIVSAFSGLLIGIVLDMVLLRRWIRRFYTANLWWMAAMHAALCLVAVAFFMGVPIGTFGLGLIAGVYMGRREFHTGSTRAPITHSLRRTAFFAASLTAGAALPIGLMALQDASVIGMLEGIPGFDPGAAGGVAGIALVCLLCLTLFGVQYWCTLQAGWLALRLNVRGSQAGAPGAGPATPIKPVSAADNDRRHMDRSTESADR